MNDIDRIIRLVTDWQDTNKVGYEGANDVLHLLVELREARKAPIELSATLKKLGEVAAERDELRRLSESRAKRILEIAVERDNFARDLAETKKIDSAITRDNSEEIRCLRKEAHVAQQAVVALADFISDRELRL